MFYSRCLSAIFVFQKLQLMLQQPTPVGEPLPPFTDSDPQQPFLHDLTTAGHQVLQPMDNNHLAGQYDSDFITQPTTGFDPSLTDSEMVAVTSAADIGLSEFGFPPLDVNMAEDGMVMPDLLSTLSTDIARLLYN